MVRSDKESARKNRDLGDWGEGRRLLSEDPRNKGDRKDLKIARFTDLHHCRKFKRTFKARKQVRGGSESCRETITCWSQSSADHWQKEERRYSKSGGHSCRNQSQ